MKLETITKTLTLASVLLLSTVITACGGGGSGTNNSGGGSTMTLSGTAATGAAIIGSVNIYGSNGGEIFNIPIDASGNFTVDISGLTAPYYLSAVPDNNSLPTQFSFASTAGTTNITPLTTLILFYANGGQSPGQLINSWPSDSQAILASALNSQELINANLAGQFPLQNIDFTTFDFLTSVFSIGGAFDQILDQIIVNITNNTALVTIAGNSTFVFDSNIDTSTINIGGSDNSNPGGETGSFGSLSVTGLDASVVNGRFVSASVEVFPSTSVPGAASIMWRASDIGYTVSFGLNSDDTVRNVAIGFAVINGNEVDIYHYHGECTFGEPLADCSAINIQRANKQIQFNSFSVPIFAPGQAGNVASGPITISGTLLWE